MSEHRNALGQPVGFPVPGWSPRPRPPRTAMTGRLVRVEPLDPERHAADLHAANAADRDGAMWTHMASGPFAGLADYRAWMARTCLGEDPLFHAVVERASGRALGLAAYLRIDPGNGVIEVGHIVWAPALQRTPAATEAMYLMMARVFDELGYRRCEWKCDALNAPSRAAAERLGFTFEGIFRQAVVYKGRNRDTAWYAVIDRDWPALKAAFQRWLDPSNFDAAGRQRTRLSDLTRRG
ncbi:MAG: GNAT family N-acetyltransferase [Rhodospirillaceae bacterium]|nr:GNAT family N-acetyltransferase [Rhodospirillaceae bacterium]